MKFSQDPASGDVTFTFTAEEARIVIPAFNAAREAAEAGGRQAILASINAGDDLASIADALRPHAAASSVMADMADQVAPLLAAEQPAEQSSKGTQP